MGKRCSLHAAEKILQEGHRGFIYVDMKASREGGRDFWKKRWQRFRRKCGQGAALLHTRTLPSFSVLGRAQKSLSLVPFFVGLCWGISTQTALIHLHTVNKASAYHCFWTPSSRDMRILCNAGRLKEALRLLNQGRIRADSDTYVYVLQECISLKSLAEGKQVHAHIIQSGFKPNIFLFNTLVNMYCKCGSVVDARQVFDKMPELDIFTWNTMIAGYAKHGYGGEAFKIYAKMQREGVIPNSITFIGILNACARVRALEKGKQVHSDIVTAGIGSYINLENTLVDMYAKCGSMKEAHHVFNNMAERDAISWNSMIAGYAQHGWARKAFEMYEQMQREGVTPNAVTYICVLNACPSLGALGKGKQVHADIIKAKIDPDIVLETALADMYAKCGSMTDALRVFKNMAKPNVVSWNAMITGYAQLGCGREAFDMYEQMQREGVIPNKITFVCILNACTSLGALEKGKQVHAAVMKAQIAQDIMLETALLDMYAKCGSIKDACQVFDNMAERNVVSWNAMIGGYVQHGCCREAFEFYEQMQRKGVTPDNITFIGILNACASLEDLEKGKEVHGDIRKAGMVFHINLDNTLIDMYAKCGSMKDAHEVFDDMPERDVVSWNALLAGYAQHGRGHEAVEMYEVMQQEGVAPDRVTYMCVLNVCATLGALGKGKKVHADIRKGGIVSYTPLENTLVNMYAKCGSVNDARLVFDCMDERDLVSWTVMIAGCAHHGCGREALQLFERMQQEGLKPDGITFLFILSACSHVGLVDEGCHYFDSMIQDHGLTPIMEHFGCMVDLLGRAGRVVEAENFMKRMPIEADASVWGALLGACSLHGDVEAAERAAKNILNIDPQNAAAYVQLSNIYIAAGRWDEKANVRKSMENRYPKGAWA